MTDAFNQHLSKLIRRLTDAGVDALAEMLANGRITAYEKRNLQNQFCRGMSSAHFTMAEPKKAVETNLRTQGDRCVDSKIDHNIRMAAENFLVAFLGEGWRNIDLSVADDDPEVRLYVHEHLPKLRAAVLAKPSEIKRPEWSKPKE